MKTPAQKIQGRIKEFCDRNGVHYNKTIAMSVKGWPDVQIVIDGITIYFEVKTPGDTISPAQKNVHRKLNSKIKICYVVKSFDEFLDIYTTLAIFIKRIIKKVAKFV